MNEFEQQSFSVEQKYESLNMYMAKTFGWMFAGLMVTFLIAFFGYRTGMAFRVLSVPYAILVLTVAELALVVFLSAKITTLSVNTARALFLVYAALNGVVFSGYFLIYGVSMLIFVFAVTSVFFGVMAVIGLVTNADLTRIRPLLTGGLIFLLVFWILASFINLDGMVKMVSAIGIFIFLLMTIYDTQKIRMYYTAYAQDAQMAKKVSIFGALQLYLDFINLFVHLLRYAKGGSRK